MFNEATRASRATAAILLSAVLTAVSTATVTQAAILQINLLPTGQTSASNTGASGRLTFEFADGPQDTFTLRIENTTPVSVGSKLTAVAFELPDSLAALPVFASGGTSSFFDELKYNLNLTPKRLNAPGGFDLAITSDGKFKGGSTSVALGPGEFQQIKISLGNTPFDANQLYTQFQTLLTQPNLVIGRFQSVGSGGKQTDLVAGQAIPEPSTMGLLACGQFLFWCMTPGKRR